MSSKRYEPNTLWRLVICVILLTSVTEYWLNLHSQSVRNRQKEAVDSRLEETNSPTAVALIAHKPKVGQDMSIYQLMSDGSWQNIRSWQSPDINHWSLNISGTRTPGLFRVDHTYSNNDLHEYRNDDSYINSRGEIIPTTVGREASRSFILPSGGFLVSGYQYPDGGWPEQQATNQNIYRLDQDGQIRVRYRANGLIDNSLDALYVNDLSADGRRAYLSVGGYEGNMVDHLWRLDLTNGIVTAVAGAANFSYANIQMNGPDEKGLIVSDDIVECQSVCFGGEEYAPPSKVVWLDLKTDKAIDILRSEKNFLRLIISANRRTAYINEHAPNNERSEIDAQGLWRVNMMNGQIELINKHWRGISTSAKGRFVLISLLQRYEDYDNWQDQSPLYIFDTLANTLTRIVPLGDWQADDKIKILPGDSLAVLPSTY